MKKYSNLLWGLAIGALGLAGLIWLASAGNSGGQNIQGPSNGSLSAEETSFDFGSISMAKGKVSHIFKIKNNSSDQVDITKVYTSCMCTEATLINKNSKKGPFGMPGHGIVPSISEQLNPGEEAEVEVVFDPAAHGPAGIGTTQRVVSLENNGKSRLDISISANVTP